MLVNAALSVDDCHWILPVCPLADNVMLLAPEQMLPAPEMLPANGVGFTTMLTALLNAASHGLLDALILKYVVAFKLAAVYVLDVAPEISVNELLSKLFCHWIEPTDAVTLRLVLLVPAQITADPLTVPALLKGFT